nr:MAG TPA: tail component [Caudoviricetes sp.]
MRKQLRKDLSDDRILNKCDGGIHYLHKKENVQFKNTYIEYEIIEHIGNQYFGDNRGVDEYVIQVDVFTKGSFVEISEAILNVMEEKGYLLMTMMLMRMKQSYIVIKLNLDITKIGGNFLWQNNN